jgi:hypothetical protein
MFRMRARFAIAILVFGIAAVGEACAADLTGGRSAYVSSYSAGGVRAPQLLVYDNEPGVYVRAYWTTPWQGRRYFPFTGKKPKVGRHERLTEVRPAPPLAETFYREWSTIALFPPPPRPVIVREQSDATPGALK